MRLQTTRRSKIEAPRPRYYAVPVFIGLLAVALIALRLPLTATAATSGNVYFAQAARGANNGADCADAYAYNDPANGINRGQNWAPGNTLHVCGTISVGAGQNIVSAQASGTSGSPITIKFEPGAILNAPHFGTGSNAGIYLSGHSYIVVDGGNTGNATSGTLWTGGLIENYANGSSGANNCPGINNTNTGACTSQVIPTTVIEMIGSNNITIENLGPCVSAVVTSGNFSNGAPGVACVHFQGSNVTITNNQFVWDGIGIDNTYYGNDTNTVISNNYFTEQGWALGCAGPAVTNTNYQFHGNWLHNFEGWTQTGAHVNGIHCYDGSGGGIASFYLYNNVFDGNMGSGGWTSWVYLESNGPGDNWNNNTGTLYAFNNVFVDSVGLNNNAILNTGGGVGDMIVNNYFYGDVGGSNPNGNGTCLQAGGVGLIIENNVFNNCAQIIVSGPMSGQTPSYSVFDYNVYGKAQGGNSIWQWNSIGVSTLAAWQAACSCDTHSTGNLSSLLADITKEGAPSAGYIGLAWGANLSDKASGLLAALAFGTTAGNTVTPVSRPTGSCSTQGISSCWTIGAYYQSGGGTGNQPTAPTDLTAAVQ